MSVAKIPPIADGSWMLLKTMMFAKPWGYELHALLTPQHGAELGEEQDIRVPRSRHPSAARPAEGVPTFGRSSYMVAGNIASRWLRRRSCANSRGGKKEPAEAAGH